VLRVEDLRAGYERGAPIVRGVSIEAKGGEVVAILGPNGAGKSTLVKAIAGTVPIESGAVILDGRNITARPAHRMAGAGLGFVPQTDNVFTTLSVTDNLRIAAHGLSGTQRRTRLAAIFELFPDLGRQRGLDAGRLSGGQRQMLAVARALIVMPKALLLDEPSAGLSPKVVAELLAKLAEIRDSGVCIVLVEQNVRAALTVADRLYVLVEGRNRLEGPKRDLLQDPEIAALYLGGATRAAGAGAGP
jgi:branched-chain amino acid transport system ATP-binding protein